MDVDEDESLSPHPPMLSANFALRPRACRPIVSLGLDGSADGGIQKDEPLGLLSAEFALRSRACQPLVSLGLEGLADGGIHQEGPVIDVARSCSIRGPDLVRPMRTAVTIATVATEEPNITNRSSSHTQKLQASSSTLKSQQSLPAVAIMSTEVDQSILHGVPTAVVLKGFGACFRRHEFLQEDYNKSVPVRHLDDFISHDWGSSWLGKTLALCLIYNGWPAALWSLVAGLVVGILQSRWLSVLPSPKPDKEHVSPLVYYSGYWCVLVCPIVFALVFVFWQDMRGYLRFRPKSAFVDKFCIDQADVDRKTMGILGLGGFLRHTHRFVILWTPSYFTRLWCTYEVASWLHLQKPMEAVEFLPLSHVQSIICTGALNACIIILDVALMIFLDDSLSYAILVVAAVVLLPLAIHALRRQIHELQKLPDIIEQFSIVNAGCFCCANNHVHPDNPEGVMACDREVVFATVASWFQAVPDSEADMVDAETARSFSMKLQDQGELEEFNARMREIFGTWVLQHAGPTKLPYEYMLFCSWPLLFRACDLLAGFGAAPNGLILRTIFIDYVVSFLAIGPLLYKFCLRLALWVDRRVGILDSCCCDLLVSLGCTLPFMMMWLVLWFPLSFATSYFNNPLPSIVWGLVVVAVCLAVFRDDFKRLLKKLVRRANARAQPGQEESSGGLDPAKIRDLAAASSTCTTTCTACTTGTEGGHQTVMTSSAVTSAASAGEVLLESGAHSDAGVSAVEDTPGARLPDDSV